MAGVPPPLPPKTRRNDHVVKIRINPGVDSAPIRISVGQTSSNNNPYFFCCQTSGQTSPSDTLDSGTCSDLDGSTPPPLPKKTATPGAVTVTVNGQHRRTGSATSSGAEVDSEDEVASNISCDSLQEETGFRLHGLREEDEEEAGGEGDVLKVITGEAQTFSSNQQVLKAITGEAQTLSSTQQGLKSFRSDGQPIAVITNKGETLNSTQQVLKVINSNEARTQRNNVFNSPDSNVLKIVTKTPVSPTSSNGLHEEESTTTTTTVQYTNGFSSTEKVLKVMSTHNTSASPISSNGLITDEETTPYKNGFSSTEKVLKVMSAKTPVSVTSSSEFDQEESSTHYSNGLSSTEKVLKVMSVNSPVSSNGLSEQESVNHYNNGFSSTDKVLTMTSGKSFANAKEDSNVVKPASKVLKIVTFDSGESSTDDTLKFVSTKTPMSPTGSSGLLPDRLLQDIRDRSAKLSVVPVSNNATLKKPKTRAPPPQKPVVVKQSLPTREPEDLISGPKRSSIVQERTYEERVKERCVASPEPTPGVSAGRYKYEDDRFYKFHLRERDDEPAAVPEPTTEEQETFAGVRDLMDASCTIRSAKGTVRGVKNRVRAGIATFLQFPDTKNYKEKEAGKVVVYTTTMGIVRETYQECLKVKKILRTLLVKYEERDVFMSREVQSEIRERMHCDVILVPQVFVEGQHIGDAETIERLNETGELRRIMKPFKSPDVCNTCQVCGGFRLLPCSVCNGSKKSVHRNDFTLEFVSLKCMHCDEVGLVRCYAC